MHSCARRSGPLGAGRAPFGGQFYLCTFLHPGYAVSARLLTSRALHAFQILPGGGYVGICRGGDVGKFCFAPACRDCYALHIQLTEYWYE